MGQLSVDLSAKMEALSAKTTSKPRTGVVFPRFFTARLEAGKTPYDDVQWETRTASIGNDKGGVIFEQRDVETPADWSQTATNIVASKYFHGKLGAPERETSVAQLVERVVDTIATEMAYIRVTREGLVLEEIAPGLTAEDVQRVTEARLIVSKNLKVIEN